MHFTFIFLVLLHQKHSLCYVKFSCSNNINESLHVESIDDPDNTLPYEFEDILLEQTTREGEYELNQGQLSEIMFIFRVKNNTKWKKKNVTLKDLKTILSSTDRLNKELLRPEVLEVVKYINQKLVRCGKELKVRNVTKLDMVNELSRLLRDGKQLEKRPRKRILHAKPLKDMAASVLLKYYNLHMSI